jgi:hypothetical protein
MVRCNISLALRNETTYLWFVLQRSKTGRIPDGQQGVEQ